MPILTTPQMNGLQTRITNGDIAGFYNDLISFGDPYGYLGLSHTNNDGWRAKLSNLFAASGAADNDVDLSFGSPDFLILNQAVAQAYLDAYINNSGVTPDREDIHDFHRIEYVDIGADANDWLLDKLLNDSSDPDALWDDLLITHGAGDLWNDMFDVSAAGAGLAFPPYFSASALTDPDFLEKIEFARKFWNAMEKLSDADRLDMVEDVTGVPWLSDVVDLVNALPERVDNLLDAIGRVLDDPSGALDKLVPDWVPFLLDPLTDVPGRSPGGGGVGGGGLEPLVFDLDASGTIDLVSLANGVHFDFWGDGYAEKVGWAAPTDGMLAIDLDESGAIDSGAELFGSEFPLTYIIEANWTQFTEEENGFAKLAKYDLVANGGNNDGAITSADDVWSDLVMWQDSNSDGVSQSGEMLTLGSFGITSIDVSDYELENFNGLSSGTPFSRIIQGNTVTHTGTFTMNSVEREVVDVWFSNDLINTVYAGDYTLDTRTLFLPTVRGYGMIADLHVAMSINEDLLDDVADFVVNHSFEDLFDDANADVENIMLSWAGLDANALPDYDYSKHGMFEGLKEYWFLRKFLGQDNDGVGTWFDMKPYMPYVDDAMSAMLESYGDLLDAFSARLVFQSGGAALFDDGVSYNPITDEFEGTFALSQDAVDDLETAAGTSGDVEEYWRAVAKFIDNTMGLGELSGTELGWLNDAVDDSSSGALDWSDIVASLSPNVVEGTSGNDTINGTAFDDVLNVYDDTQPFFSGSAGTDTINGLAGNDILWGGNGDDTLSGGLGNDIMYGEAGNDTYIYDYGHDVIVETSQNYYTDVVQLASGITVSDVTLHMSRMDSTQPHFFLEIEGRGTLTIKTQIGVAAQTLIDQIQFSGGPTWYFTSSAVYFHGTGGDDSFSTAGFDGNSFYYGYGGNDVLQAQAGNDVLDGGEGNDDLRGSDGNDTYVVSAGDDVIRETAGTDKIVVPEGYTLDDVSFFRTRSDGGEMKIVVDGLGSITVIDVFGTGQNGKIVESLEIDGESPINLLTTVFTTLGTTGNDFIQGTYTTWAQQNDVYLFSGGTDTLYEYGGTDTVLFGAGIGPGDITINRVSGNSYSDIRISDAFGNSLTVQRHFGSSATTTALETLKFANGTTVALASMEIEALGTSGADTIFDYDWGGLSTKDIVHSLAGADQVQTGNGDDEVHGGDGADNLDGGADNDVIYGDDGNDYIQGGSGNDVLYGGAGNDTIQGQGGTNVIEGGAGNDLLYGYSGSTTVTYANAASGISGSLYTGSVSDGDGGTDTLYSVANLIGSAYADTITGDNSDNILKGGAGDDTISGLYGNDTLYGGAGTDSLTGAQGADTFVFEIASAFANQDTIADFSTAQSDKIDIHDVIDIEFDPLTEAIADFVNFTNSGANSIMSIDRDGTGTTYSFADVATLNGVTNLNETTLYNNGNLLAA